MGEISLLGELSLLDMNSLDIDLRRVAALVT